MGSRQGAQGDWVCLVGWIWLDLVGFGWFASVGYSLFVLNGQMANGGFEIGGPEFQALISILSVQILQVPLLDSLIGPCVPCTKRTRHAAHPSERPTLWLCCWLFWKDYRTMPSSPGPTFSTLPEEFRFPPGIFEIDEQLLVPAAVSILGHANPNDMSSPTKTPDWTQQTLFLATKGDSGRQIRSLSPCG